MTAGVNNTACTQAHKDNTVPHARVHKPMRCVAAGTRKKKRRTQAKCTEQKTVLAGMGKGGGEGVRARGAVGIT